MTPDKERAHQIWLRWLRITRRRPAANVSGDIMVRANEQKTIGDAVDAFDKRVNKPTKLEELWT